jgi:hypothetical protein
VCPRDSVRGVSCPKPTACIAVGHYYANKTNLTLAEVWNGTTWKFRATKNPSP